MRQAYPGTLKSRLVGRETEVKGSATNQACGTVGVEGGLLDDP